MKFWQKIFGKERRESLQTPQAEAGTDAGPAVGSAEGAAAESGSRMPGVLLKPHLTEKTSNLKGAYAFRVAREANKRQVAQAVESRYGVGVEDVRIVNLPPKMRRRGRQIGWKRGFKKAMVSLKDGHTIEVQ